jgi:hypothetical protein
MNIEDAIKILEDHNEWRRGKGTHSMTNPTELGIAIDTIIRHFKKSKIDKKIKEIKKSIKNI